MRNTIKTRSGKTLIVPTEAEESAINKGIAADADVPELTEDQIKRMRPFKEIVAEKRRKTPKELVSIRYDADVLEYFRAEGSGWQTRINDVLRDYVKTHPHK